MSSNLMAGQSGTFPLTISSSLNAQLHPGNGKKRKTPTEEIYAFRYAFKPASISHVSSGIYEAGAGEAGSSQVIFDSGPTGQGQVFDVREEASKARECVLMFDQSTKTFALHALPTTLHLTLNRNASSSAAAAAAAAASRRPASLASSTSSSSVPLSKRPSATPTVHNVDAEAEVDGDSFSSGDMRHEVSSMIGVEETPRPKKKVKTDDSSITTANAQRPTKSGKGLPLKRPPMESAPIPIIHTVPKTTISTTTTQTKTKGKSGKGKAAAASDKGKAVPSTPKLRGTKSTVMQSTPSKIKSAEYIEDSDEEIAASGGGGEEDDEDMFARMVGESLAQDDSGAAAGEGNAYDDEDDEDEEEEEEESEDDDALGGARLIVGAADGEEEWI